MINQNWTSKKIICYISYRILFKHLPEDIPVIGKWFHILRRFVWRPLFKEAVKTIGVGQGVNFDNGCNIIMKEYVNIGKYASMGGNFATITFGKHIMMGAY